MHCRSGPLSAQLPTSCLTTEPRFDTLNATLSISGHKPLLELNTGREQEAKVTPICVDLDKIMPVGGHATVAVAMNVVGAQGKANQREAHLAVLRWLLTRLIDSNPPERHFDAADEAEDPASVRVLWVSKWVDCTYKYGLGYQLCDNSIGVLFNDNTRMMLLTNQVRVCAPRLPLLCRVSGVQRPCDAPEKVGCPHTACVNEWTVYSS